MWMRAGPRTRRWARRSASMRGVDEARPDGGVTVGQTIVSGSSSRRSRWRCVVREPRRRSVYSEPALDPAKADACTRRQRVPTTQSLTLRRRPDANRLQRVVRSPGQQETRGRAGGGDQAPPSAATASRSTRGLSTRCPRTERLPGPRSTPRSPTGEAEAARARRRRRQRTPTRAPMPLIRGRLRLCGADVVQRRWSRPA